FEFERECIHLCPVIIIKFAQSILVLHCRKNRYSNYFRAQDKLARRKRGNPATACLFQPLAFRVLHEEIERARKQYSCQQRRADKNESAMKHAHSHVSTLRFLL